MHAIGDTGGEKIVQRRKDMGCAIGAGDPFRCAARKIAYGDKVNTRRALQSIRMPG